MLSKLNNYIILFLPFTFFTGPFVPELVIIYLIFSSFFLKIIKLEKNYFLLGLIFFYVIILINLSITENTAYEKSLGFIRIILFILLIHYTLIHKKNELIKAFVIYKYILILFLLFIFFHSLLSYFSDISLLRVSSILGDEKILGSAVTKLFFLFVIFYFLNNRDSSSNGILILISLMVIILTLLSGERSALSHLIFYFILFFTITKSIKSSKKIFILISILVIFLLSISFSERLKFRIIDQTLAQLGIAGPSIYTEKIIAGVPRAYIKQEKIYFAPMKHKLMHITAINIFKDNIFIGSGLKTFREICDDEKYNIKYLHPGIDNPYPGFDEEDGCSSHPHNYYFETLSELGIFSTILVLILFSSTIYYIIKYKTELNNFHISTIIPILILFFPLNSSGSLLNNWNICYLSIFIAFYYNFINHEVYKLQKKNK